MILKWAEAVGMEDCTVPVMSQWNVGFLGSAMSSWWKVSRIYIYQCTALCHCQNALGIFKQLGQSQANMLTMIISISKFRWVQILQTGKIYFLKSSVKADRLSLYVGKFLPSPLGANILWVSYHSRHLHYGAQRMSNNFKFRLKVFLKFQAIKCCNEESKCGISVS